MGGGGLGRYLSREGVCSGELWQSRTRLNSSCPSSIALTRPTLATIPPSRRWGTQILDLGHPPKVRLDCCRSPVRYAPDEVAGVPVGGELALGVEDVFNISSKSRRVVVKPHLLVERVVGIAERRRAGIGLDQVALRVVLVAVEAVVENVAGCVVGVAGDLVGGLVEGQLRRRPAQKCVSDVGHPATATPKSSLPV